MPGINKALDIIVDEGVGPLLGKSALYAGERLQHWVKRLAYSNSPYGHQIMAGLVDRPYYAYCIHEAAKLGEILGYDSVSVLEFGVGDGTGLENIEMHVEEVERLFDVEIEIYGFDTGEGPPSPDGYKDMPHAYDYEWSHSAYKDYAISEWQARATLVLGEIGETRDSFFEEYDPAPIGCAFFLT